MLDTSRSLLCIIDCLTNVHVAHQWYHSRTRIKQASKSPKAEKISVQMCSKRISLPHGDEAVEVAQVSLHAHHPPSAICRSCRKCSLRTQAMLILKANAVYLRMCQKNAAVKVQKCCCVENAQRQTLDARTAAGSKDQKLDICWVTVLSPTTTTPAAHPLTSSRSPYTMSRSRLSARRHHQRRRRGWLGKLR
jgi:hypothetical protein